MSRTPGGYQMSSTKTFPPSHATSQTEDPSTRLSLAIVKLDQLIIRVANIGTLTDRSFLETSHIRFISQETDATNTPELDHQIR